MEMMKLSKRSLYELIAVIALSQMLFWSVPGFKFAYTFLPFTYILADKWIRHRSWLDFGFKRRDYIKDLKSNWLPFVTVVFVSHPVTVLGSRYWYPELYTRFLDRVQLLAQVYSGFSPAFAFLPLITLSVFLEEMVFRGFVQERLSWFSNKYIALIMSSLIFTISHFSTGRFDVVTADLLGVFLDSCLYGLMYAGSRNIFTAFGAHLIGDYIDLILMLNF